MEQNLNAYQGCLMGLAVGDAMGFAIDDKSWQEIQEAYGPNGLLGYDLQQEEYAQISSYTQLTAFLCNGLLLGVTRGKNDWMRFCRLALQEWSRSQMFHRDPEKSWCWVSKLPYFRRRYCRDVRMADVVRLESFGTVESPRNRYTAPGAMTAAVAVGMFYNLQRMEPMQVGKLTTDLLALTHGDPTVFLSGAVLAYAIVGILHDTQLPLAQQFRQAITVMENQFGSRYYQAEELAERFKEVIAMAQGETETPQAVMERLGCTDAAGCLAGAMYACLSAQDDFDTAIVTAVNHSGVSCAVGAITGAIMGAKLGEEALPEFYWESLECSRELGELAKDMICGTPTLGIFDDEWDHKYVQCLPPE